MILVCPEAYAAAHASFAAKFDSVVTYERIAAQLCARAGSESGELRARLEFRSRLVEQAVSKGRRGYVPVPVPSIENFNARYVALLAEIAPEIFPGQTMLRSGKPGDSVSMIYDERRSLDFLAPDVMPRRFSHELGRNQNHRANYVAVTFGGWGRALPLAGTEMLACVERSGISLHAARRTPNRPNPGLVMSLPTPPVDNQGNFDSQFVAVRQGIAQAIALRAWLADNQALLRTWSRTISGIRA
jgi:hypothetical protein